ncbi:glycosyltransferase family 25 protein [Xanthobacter sp. KR7-65]|uniref:glycosyltransferase family 25 protein n=1 Tax=Xanthobacter sp. KR7-65 TaxID=3156612 RepID=UPI0032B362A7
MLVQLVNLERRPDRLAFMRRQLDDLGIAFQRLEAIDGTEAGVEPATPGFSGAERACAFSHRLAWERFLASGAPHCLVLEDDVILSPLLPAFLAGFAGIPHDGDILRLETQLVRTRLGPPLASPLAGYEAHRVHSVHTGCGAYILTRAFAARAVRDLIRFDAPLDYVLFDPDWPGFYPSRFFQLRPALCIQANLHEPTRDAAIGVSNLQPAREVRFAIASRLNPKPKRTFAEKCVREVGRWVRRIRAFAGRAWDFPTRPSFWYDVPFAGAVLPSALTMLSGSRVEPDGAGQGPGARGRDAQRP